MYVTLGNDERNPSTFEPSGVGTRGDQLPGWLTPSEDSSAEPCDAPPHWVDARPSGLATGQGGALFVFQQPQSEDGGGTSGELVFPPPRLDGEADETQSEPRLVGLRIDALVVAYRVQLSAEARSALRGSSAKATTHGKAELSMVIPGKSGYLDQERCIAQLIAQKGERVCFANGDLRGIFIETLADAEEPGWSLELTARATYLAQHPLGDVVQEFRTWARTFGHVVEERLRRVDLCADFTGWRIKPEDAEAYVRPPRSTLTSFASYPKPDDDTWTKTYRRAGTIVTGHTVCPGNALMMRCYDKTQELDVTNNQEKRRIEEAIWSEAGWRRGDQVTRIEFQIRGEASKELLSRSVDRLLRECPGLWRYCTEKWVRLVDPTTNARLRRCDLDSRWRAVQSVHWGPRQPRLERSRTRGMATVTQAFGTALTALAQAERVPCECTDRDGKLSAIAIRSPEHARGVLATMVDAMSQEFGEMAQDALIGRHEGNAAEAAEFVVTRARAAEARALQENRSHTNEVGEHPMGTRRSGVDSIEQGADSSALPTEKKSESNLPHTPGTQTTREGRGHRHHGNVDMGQPAPWVPITRTRPESIDEVRSRVIARGKRNASRPPLVPE